MSHEIFSLKTAAAHVHLDENELKHAAQRGEIESIKRGDEWFFEHRVLDEWAQRNLLAAGEKELSAQHRVMMDEHRREDRRHWAVADFFDPSAIDLEVRAKGKAGVLRDLTELADRGGKVYDADGLYKELEAREAAAPTAIGEGVALPHPRFHDPYLFEESFVAYGRSVRPVFFGAPEGEGTRHFFLVCSTDHEMHLHILARLAMLAHGTELIARLETAETAEEAIAILRECEGEFCQGQN